MNRECAAVCWTSAALMSMDTNLQNSFAIYVLISAMHVLRGVKYTMLTTARDAHKHVVAVRKNVEGWLDNQATPIF
jgi:hypothetical protein